MTTAAQPENAGLGVKAKPQVAPLVGPDAALLTNSLPGAPRAYALQDGFGLHFLVGGLVATVLARSIDSDGLFEAAILTGGVGATMPAHRHREFDEALLVLDGQVELWLDGRVHLLSRGDYANVPAGTLHGHRMASHRSRLLTYTMGGKAGALYSELGALFSRPIPPELPNMAIEAARLARAEAAADVEFERKAISFEGAKPVTDATIPLQRLPYVLRSGEGERRIAAEQLFTIMGTNAVSDGRFISVMNEGSAGEMIPPHYHAQHTENFLCLDGLMTMMVSGKEISLHPGDYLQIPARYIHAYRLDSPYARFFGWLTPGVFEPFFRLLGDPYEPYGLPLVPPPFRFDRVVAKLDTLDLYPLQRPGPPK